MSFNTLESIEWKQNNKDTFICYSCSQGYILSINFDIFYLRVKIFFSILMKGEPTNYYSGVTLFGDALMYSINQFACQEDLHKIYNRVSFFFNIRLKNSMFIIILTDLFSDGYIRKRRSINWFTFKA